MRMSSRPLQFPIQFYGARRMRSQKHLILAPSSLVTGSALKISHQVRRNMTLFSPLRQSTIPRIIKNSMIFSYQDLRMMELFI